MSDARQQRFEIDIEEIERQLRRSAEGGPAPRPDPLAELARIVGQDDPFRGILGGPARPPAGERAAAAAEAESGLSAEQRAVLGAEPQAGSVPGEALYDPVADAYGAPENAFDADDIQPLRPRRSRKPLFAVVALLLLATGAVAGFLVWRSPGGLGLSGAPPLVTADRSPLKVAPENPGGMDVPNQNRQIYDRSAPEGQSRVVDTREQPLDVREVVRNLPPPPNPPAAATTAGLVPPVGSGAPSGTAQPGAVASRLPAATSPAPRSAVNNALGEPRRVRTVAVRPDGTIVSPDGTTTPPAPAAPAAPPTFLPGAGLPPPVPVQTLSIPANPAAAPAPAAPAVAGGEGSTPPSGPAPVTVLPPERPKLNSRSSSATPAAPAAAARTASAADASESEAERPSAPAARGGYSVQIAVRPSEDEARTAYSQLADRYATDLGGKPAGINRAEVGGRTIYRVRVGPLSRDDANTLCTRLKSSGGQCFVAGN